MTIGNYQEQDKYNEHNRIYNRVHTTSSLQKVITFYAYFS